MSTQQQVRYWLISLAVLLALVWLLSSILLPFVAGMAVAYFLDPPTDKLEQRGLGRGLATSLVVIVFFVLMVLATLLLVPILQSQVLGFADRLPGYIAGLRETALPVLTELGAKFGIDVGASAGDAAKEIAADAVTFGFKLLRQAWSGGLALFNILTLLVITPVVAFYLLRDFDHMTAALNSWLPRQHAKTIRGLLSDIDSVMAGFIRGQGTVCLILASYYGLALTFAGLEFGLIIGLFSGLVSFIPFVGATTGLVLSMLTALTQFLPEGDFLRIGIIAAVFVIGQVMEGYILTPRLLGDRIGLHPVWVMFALLAGGALFGFVGVLIAVPAAAAIGVMVRFALSQYLASSLYGGPDDLHSDDPPPDGTTP
ncbi:MAG: AI-2E family transporter [Alphaproteobacteria bacterium]|nr:AI-2E family transporter [Alphaproteobacteria bacterium]